MKTTSMNQSSVTGIKKKSRHSKKIGLIKVGFAGMVASGCTAQIPDSFRLAQQNEVLSLGEQINTKVDLLWVVDNSASMDMSQDRLRSGFSGFAAKYLKPSWDIRIGVITTDTFLANSAYTNYWASTFSGTIGWTSTYINGRRATFVNPVANPTLVNLSNGSFPSGIKVRDQYPLLGRSYARLLSGYHDGPMPALCSENHGYFYLGATNCRVRDDQSAYNGTSHCLHPAGAESAVSQCVNTVQNNTVRSNKPIIETMPPAGTAGDAAWVTSLVDNFMVNVSVGSSGSGSERGLASVLQMIQDNEVSATPLFRANSVRMIIFVSDEEDQSMEIPAALPAGYGPFTNYTATCSAKTVDGHTYTLSTCPITNKLIPVSTFKTAFDAFFRNLDGTTTESPNYIIASIVPTTGAAISQLQTERVADDTAVGVTSVAVDRGDRYIALGTLVGNGSMSLNLAESDYTPLLESIGQAIALKRGTFTLARAPTGQEDMYVRILHANGTVEVVSNSKYSVSGATLTLTDIDFILSLSATDYIAVNYQPRSVL